MSVLHGIEQSGTTAQRPTNAPIGHVYFDTDLGIPVTFNGSIWTGIHGKSQVVVVTTDTTLTPADSGKTFVINSAAARVLTLPATVAGLEFTLTHQVATTSGAGHAFSPAAADLIRGNGITPADDKDLICTQATSRIGDTVTLVGDGIDGWYVKSVNGTWARQA